MSDPRSPERWDKLGRLIELLATAESLEEAVQTIRFSARAVVGADGITIVRREGDTVHYVAEDSIAPLWAGQSFLAESCISGIAMMSRSPVVIGDVFTDPRVPHKAYEPTFVKSMAMFPVGSDEPMAAIGAYWSRAGEIDPETLELLASLARSAGKLFAILERNASGLPPLQQAVRPNGGSGGLTA